MTTEPTPKAETRAPADFVAPESREASPPPKRLSALVAIAVADGERALADPRYTFRAECYHTPMEQASSDEQARCAVCLAGAVMSFTLAAPLEKYRAPEDYTEWRNALIAIDLTRRGHYLEAVHWAGWRRLSAKEEQALREMPEPAVRCFQNRSGFRAHLTRLAAVRDALQSAGL